MEGGGGGGGGMFYGGCVPNMSALLQTQDLPCSPQPVDAFFISGSSTSFMGASPMVSFQDICGGKRHERSFFRTFGQDDNVDEDLDDYFQQAEKKRRLTAEQVQFLEKSFELENKLEPEKKIQLAKDLGLQPRQIAIWFQNRRARWKTKQLEKDFETLQARYDSLKVDYENLLKEREKLKAEVLHLTDRLLLREKEQGELGSSNTGTELETPPQEPIVYSASEDEAPQISIDALKHEDLGSAKSDVFDSDSPCNINAGHSFAEPGDSSYAFEPENSDLSQDEEDTLSKSLLPTSCIFPKMEDVDYPTPPGNSCNFGFHVEDHATWFWSS
ncbi:hypothetical protein Nepgr_023283 [Nepenthes gracilis]|uniref:Homeobox-leucine zipper protein n=1 Tax=Nepenthes gracilis TaxID=150966 RepID=A0AAD3T412_NEPGR|nr:hypothetical protein Nepgr_023283 [Nepenthes gracilis]